MKSLKYGCIPNHKFNIKNENLQAGVKKKDKWTTFGFFFIICDSENEMLFIKVVYLIIFDVEWDTVTFIED